MAKFDPRRYITPEARGIFEDSQHYNIWASWSNRFRAAIKAHNKATEHLSYHKKGAEYKAALAIARENIEGAVHILIRKFQQYGWIAPLMLWEITGADPVPQQHAGRFSRITADWLTWSDDLLDAGRSALIPSSEQNND